LICSRLIVVDNRKICLHLADEDRARLNAAVLELPLVEGERPERSVDDDAARPLARVVGARLCEEVAEARVVGARLCEEVAEAVAEGALGEAQLPDARPTASS
jgi:hypothetical protein